MKKILFGISSLLILNACNTSKEAGNEQQETISTSTSDNQTIDLDYLNLDVRPQDDFFEFANGTWVKNNPVPASESRWGSFNELDQANKIKLTAILEEASNKVEPTANELLLGNYYASFIDLDVRGKFGLQTIQPELDEVSRINSKKDIVRTIGEQHKMGISSLFNFGVGQDLKNVDYHIVYVSQGGLGLPNKDYYLTEDKKEIKRQYLGHIMESFKLLGYTSELSKKTAIKVVDFETKLAEMMMAPAELRIPENTYNKYHRKGAYRLFGQFNIESYIAQTGIDSFDSLVIGQPNFAEKIGSMMQTEDLDTWKAYLSWKVLNHYAGHLGEDFIKLNFSFYGTVLSGKEEMKPINERAIDEITHMPFAEVLGKEFVNLHYSDEAQKKVNVMVDNLLIVFEDRIKNLSWMSGETKEQALHKLNSVGRKLGFPDKWEDYSSLKFEKDQYILNIKASAKYSYIKNLKKLGEKVDKDKWEMPAHMVNAYYHPLLNEIAFPAGIMQPPFFSENYEDAVNYGRIGMVIGHEFTHGFDDMGSKFAADGSFTNWWSTEDRALFEERTGKLGATFAKFCPIEGECVNPDLTMGENIADIGGLTLAYHAYALTDEFKSGEIRKGYTPAQRFFIAYAQLWKIKYTDAELKNRLANDPHSPGMYRVNGPLMNCPEFFDAFNVQEEDPMRNSAANISKIW